MKPTTILVSALATLVAAAPAAEKKVEERAFNFDVNSFNNFNGFQSVNLNYLAKLNGLDLNILSLLANNNNFNIGGFQNLFAIGANQFNIQDILLLQQLFDLQQFFNAGILNNFNLGNFQFGGLNGLGFGGGILDTGLLNLGGVGLGSFVNPSVVTQVQTVAQSFLPVGGVLGGGIAGGLNSGVLSGGISSPIISSGVSSGLSSGVSSGAVSSAPSSGVVTAAEQEAQEGGSSLNRA